MRSIKRTGGVTMLERLKRLVTGRVLPVFEKEEGQALVEYALVLVMVTLLCVAFLTTMGQTVVGFFENVAQGL
jgi:Flp pilus assembly pilin Flp